MAAPNGGLKFAAAPVGPGQTAEMTTSVDFGDQGHYILFSVYESTPLVELKVLALHYSIASVAGAGVVVGSEVSEV